MTILYLTLLLPAATTPTASRLVPVLTLSSLSLSRLSWSWGWCRSGCWLDILRTLHAGCTLIPLWKDHSRRQDGFYCRCRGGAGCGCSWPPQGCYNAVYIEALKHPLSVSRRKVRPKRDDLENESGFVLIPSSKGRDPGEERCRHMLDQ